MNFDELLRIIAERKANPQAGSYTRTLLDQGEDAVLQKIGEEAVEVILAAKSQGDQRVIEEVSDLFFHLLVYWSAVATLDEMRQGGSPTCCQNEQ
jgi:phosphoribosyl-ATP pyrophosphohydrolase